MSSGNDHDKACISIGIAGGITILLTTQSPRLALLFCGGASAGLILSPDLDLPKSNARRRWGPMGWLWIPYDTAIPHRHWLSHAPIVGTAGRIVYLSTVLTALLTLSFGVDAALSEYGFSGWAYPWPCPPDELLGRIWLLILRLDPYYYLWSFAGLALADTIHLLMDLKSTADKNHRRAMQNKAK